MGEQGTLYIVPTPIGNLGDMTMRALAALNACDVVFAEDTRVTGKLLAHFDIAKPLQRLDENMMSKMAATVVERVASGEKIAYCTDAGMPGISDPGIRLIQAAREAGIDVEVLPGPSAVITAFVASAPVSDRFYFGGFLPRKDEARKSLLSGLKDLDAALIFYESPKRLVASLKIIDDVFPARQVHVCREISKLHEEIFSARSGDVLEEFAHREQKDGIKGEIVIVIDAAGGEEREHDTEELVEAAGTRARELASSGMRNKDIVRTLVEEFDIPRNRAYDIALTVKEE